MYNLNLQQYTLLHVYSEEMRRFQLNHVNTTRYQCAQACRTHHPRLDICMYTPLQKTSHSRPSQPACSTFTVFGSRALHHIRMQHQYQHDAIA